VDKEICADLALEKAVEVPGLKKKGRTVPRLCRATREKKKRGEQVRQRGQDPADCKKEKEGRVAGLESPLQVGKGERGRQLFHIPP